MTICLRLGSILIGVANPIYIFWRDGIFYTMTGVLIPFFNRNSKSELVINVVYQTITATVAGLSLIVIQVTTAITIDTVNIQTELSISKMKILTKHLERMDLMEIQINDRIVNILKQIQSIDE